jgi:hypothetical protein
LDLVQVKIVVQAGDNNRALLDPDPDAMKVALALLFYLDLMHSAGARGHIREVIGGKGVGFDSNYRRPARCVQNGSIDGRLRTDDADDEARADGMGWPRSFAVREHNNRIGTRAQVFRRTYADDHIRAAPAPAVDFVHIEDGLDAVDRRIDLKES